MSAIVLSSRRDFYSGVPKHVTFASLLARCSGIPKDQEDVARQMECYRLGIDSDADPTRWRYLLRRLMARRWNVFGYHEYRERSFDPWRYGGPVPLELERRVRAIRTTFPEMKFEIYAIKNDPWIIGVLDGHRFIIGGWYRGGIFVESYIV